MIMMKKHVVLLLLLFDILLLPGCTTFFRSKSIKSPKVEITKGQWIQLPNPAQLGFNLTATQVLTAQYETKDKTKSYASQVQVEKTPTKLILVAIAGWGGEIFSIDYDGKTIKTSSLPMPHASIGIQHVLTDFIFTYASDNLIKTLLKSTDIKLKLKKQQRIFMLHNTPIIKITYQNKNPWKGTVVLHNLKLHYNITISTIVLQPQSSDKFGEQI